MCACEKRTFVVRSCRRTHGDVLKRASREMSWWISRRMPCSVTQNHPEPRRSMQSHAADPFTYLCARRSTEIPAGSRKIHQGPRPRGRTSTLSREHAHAIPNRRIATQSRAHAESNRSWEIHAAPRRSHALYVDAPCHSAHWGPSRRLVCLSGACIPGLSHHRGEIHGAHTIKPAQPISSRCL